MQHRLFAVCLTFVCAAAFAQSFPDRPVRVIVPYPPGGSTDLVGRILGEGATESSRKSTRLNSSHT